MPNTYCATKALRQSIKRRLHNRTLRSTLRGLIRKVRSAADAGNVEGAKDALRVVTKGLDKAAAKHLIHKNTASRLKSRLAKLVHKTTSK